MPSVESKQNDSIEKDFRNRLELKLLYLCSPLFKGAKPSCLITLSPKEASLLPAILKHTGISLLFLSVTPDHVSYLLYRKALMTELLKKKKHIAFLFRYGYRNFSADYVLAAFALRYRKYTAGILKFPHEIGLLLGYPLPDVLGYLKHHGKQSLLDGYWKVYHRPRAAKRQFRYYDRLRYLAVTEYKGGATMQEICHSRPDI